MTAIDALNDLGFLFDENPPLVRLSMPRALAFRRVPAGFVALGGVEVVRFRIAGADEKRASASPGHFNAVDASPLFHFRDSFEMFHVIGTRGAGGVDEAATLRAGFLVVGSGPDGLAAAADAENRIAHLEDVLAASPLDADLRPISTAEALLDLARPFVAPNAVALRREVYAPSVLSATNRGRAEVILPWRGGDARWAGLAMALARHRGPVACVVRATGRVEVSAAVLSRSARDVQAALVQHADAMSARLDDGPQPKLAERMLAETQARHGVLLHGPIAVDVALASMDAVDDSLLSIVSAALTQSDSGEDSSQDPHCAPSLRRVPLTPGALLRPLDAAECPELLCGPREAAVLIRTIEPPIDETTPLPCTRSRRFDAPVLPSDGLVLGDATTRGKARGVRLPEQDRLRHAYVVGQTGTGKSTLLLNMIVQDVHAGQGVTVIDPHGTLVDEVLARIPNSRVNDVILVDPAHTSGVVPLNPLIVRTADPAAYAFQRDRIIDDLQDTLVHLYDPSMFGPMFEQNFRTMLALLMSTQVPDGYRPSLAMLQVVFADSGLQDALAKRLAPFDTVTRETLQIIREAGGEASLVNMGPYVTSKLTRFITHTAARRMLCHPSCLDYGDVIDRRKILLVHLGGTRVGPEAATLIARQLVLGLTVAAMGRREAAPVPHFLYVDEFHNFASHGFARLLSEARKFGLGLVLAHQYTRQLATSGGRSLLDAVLGNVGTVIAFRVGLDDATLLEDAFAPRAGGRDVAGLPNHTALVLSSGGLGGVPFTLWTRPPPPRTISPREVADAALRAHSVDGTAADKEIADELRRLKSLSSEKLSVSDPFEELLR